MKKGLFHINTSGFSLVEALLSVTLAGLIASGVAGAVIYGQQTKQIAGQRMQAGYIAEEGLEAVRNIRDASFQNLTDGTYGVTISGNQWILQPTTTTIDGFTRAITISPLDSTTKQVTSTVTWQQNQQRTGTVELKTYLSNWPTAPQAQSGNLTINTTLAALSGGNRELSGITVTNTGTASATIDKVKLSWQSADELQDIRIDNTTVWSRNGPGTPTGFQSSGTLLDIQDVVINAGITLPITRFRFNGNLTAPHTFTLEITLLDGSTKTVGPVTAP